MRPSTPGGHNHTGILCGSCNAGFSAAYFTTECVSDEECSDTKLGVDRSDVILADFHPGCGAGQEILDNDVDFYFPFCAVQCAYVCACVYSCVCYVLCLLCLLFCCISFKRYGACRCNLETFTISADLCSRQNRGVLMPSTL